MSKKSIAVGIAIFFPRFRLLSIIGVLSICNL